MRPGQGPNILDQSDMSQPESTMQAEMHFSYESQPQIEWLGREGGVEAGEVVET